MTRSLLVAFLLAGGICLGYAYSLFMAFNWTPSTEVLSLSQGSKVESLFVTEESFPYDIVLSVSKEDTEAKELLEQAFKGDKSKDALKLNWTLSGQNGSSEEGQAPSELSPRVSEKSIDFVLGSFSAKANERCTLKTTIGKSSQAFVGKTASLKIVVGQNTANHYGLRGVIYLLIGLTLFSISMIIACYLIYLWVQDQKKIIAALKTNVREKGPK